MAALHTNRNTDGSGGGLLPNAQRHPAGCGQRRRVRRRQRFVIGHVVDHAGFWRGPGRACGRRVGIGAGIAAGMAIGIAAGRKKAADDLQKYIESSQITIQNGYGETLSVEAFVGEALKTGSEKNQKVILVIVLILGLLFLLGIAAFFFLASIICSTLSN